MLHHIKSLAVICCVCFCFGLFGCTANQSNINWTADNRPAATASATEYVQTLISQKQYAFALENAMYAYKENQTSSLKEIIETYYKHAIGEYLNRMAAAEASLLKRSAYYSNLDALKKLQRELLEYKFITKQMVDIERTELVYSKYLAENVEKRALENIESGNHAQIVTGLKELNLLEKEGYQVKAGTWRAYDNYVTSLINGDSFTELTSLANANMLNKKHGDQVVQRAFVLTDQSPKVAIEQFKLANMIFSTSKFNENIKQIEYKLTKRMHVIVQNISPTIVFADEQKILSKTQNAFDGLDKYLVLNSIGGSNIHKDVPKDVYAYYQTSGKQLSFIDPVHYLVVVAIEHLDVSRSDREVQNMRTSWSAKDGGALSIAAKSSTAYGEEIKQFEFDLLSYTVTGRIGAKYLIYDTVTKKPIKTGTLEDKVQKKIEWCDKLTAVGAGKKVPASYMPSHMMDRCLRIPSIVDDGSIIESLVDSVIEQAKAEVQANLLR